MPDARRGLGGRPWRVLVVGCGSIGRRHIGNLLALGQREIRLVDPDAGTLRRACDEFDFAGTPHLDGGLAWAPEVVVVANPTADHVDTALAAARRGCHLLIEKPLGDRLDGVEELIRIAEERGLVTLVGCNMRFHPGPRLVHRILASGTLGPALGARMEVGSYLPSWRPGTDYRRSYSARKDLGGGCILDAIHEIDLACWLFGWPQAVTAMTRAGTSLGIETEELAEILLRFEGELIVSLHLDYVQRWRQRRCEVIADGGTVLWESRTDDVRVFTGEATEPERLGYEAAYDINQMYVEELRHFLRCVSGLDQPCADVAWAARVTQVALAAKASARTHQPVELEWESSSRVSPHLPEPAPHER